MSDVITYDDLFKFDNSVLTRASTAIGKLETAYTKFATNLTAEATRISQAQGSILPVLQQLETLLGKVSVASDAGRRNAAGLASEIDKQTRASAKLKEAQSGVATTSVAVAGSLEALRGKLKADREELTKLGESATPEKLMQLAGSILNTKTQAEQLERAVRGVNSVFTATKGSYNALVAENRALSLELKNLGGVFDENGQRVGKASAREVELNAKLSANILTLKNYDAELNQHYRNVGNYTQSIVEAITSLKSERVALLNQEAALTASAAATNLAANVQDKLQKELDETRAKLKTNAESLNAVGVETKKTGGFLSGAGAELKSFAIQMAISTVGLTALAGLLGQAFRNNLKYSDSISDVRKTTGLAADEAEAFGTALKGIDTRTDLDSLLKIGAIGGQLNVAKKDLEDFTRGIDTASVALSDDFAGGAEQVATELGKIDAIFKVSAKDGVAGAINNIGSALNDLGASGAATAPFIADYALRVGAIAKNAGLGIDKVLGMGAALEELGFTAEVAGTATNKLLGGLSGNSSKFYSIAKLADANLTLKEFKSLINNDVNKALELFLKGLNKGGAATTDFAELVQSLKIKGSSATAVLTALAKNTELLGEKQVIANNSMREGTSLIAEATLKNNNFAGSYDRLKNAIVNATTGNTLFARALKTLFNATAALINGNTVFGVTLNEGKKAVDDFGASAALTAGKTLDAATASNKLLANFTMLSSATNRSAGDNATLRKTVLALKEALGENVVVLNTETGQYDLNAGAAAKAIAAKRTESLEAVKMLAKRAATLGAEAEAQRALSKATEEEVANRIAVITAGGLTLDKIQEQQKARELKRANVSGAGRDAGLVSDATLDAYARLEKLNDSSAIATKKATDAEAARAKILKVLAANGFSLQFQTDLLREAEKGLSVATNQGTEDAKAAAKAAKELAKAQAELAQSEYELARFRAEQLGKKFTRQSENEANPETFRLEAAQKASAQAVVVAQLEQKERLRLAKEEAKDLVGGDEILRIKRQLISEQYAARIGEIERELTKEQLAIHNEALTLLEDVDKFRLESENNNLKKIIENEDAGFAVRTEAQKRFAANTILLANLAYNEEIRNAKGNVEKIKLALDKLGNATGAARDSVKPFDSKSANDDTDINYKSQQIALEETRRLGLVTEKEYQEQRKFLEKQYLQEHLTNTQVEFDGTKNALDEELNLIRLKNDEEIEEEKRKAEAKQAIIQESAELLSSIGAGINEVYSAGLDKQLDALQRQKDSELALAGNNAKAKQKIEADFDRKQAAIKKKQAIAAKAEALFQVALQTGVAVATAVAKSPETFGLPFSAFALANGLIQAGIILAKPIPAFAKGTESSPAGPALVGERGAELLEHSGRMQLVTKPMIVNLKGGTKVYNARDTVKYFRDNAMSKQLADGYSEGEKVVAQVQRGISPIDVARVVGREIGGKFESLENAVRSQPGLSMSMDKNGVHAYVTQAGITTEYFNKRYHRGPSK